MTFNTVLLAILAFTAVVLLCAVWIGLRRPTQADPFFQPFGDMPWLTEAQQQQLRVVMQTPMTPEQAEEQRRSFTYGNTRLSNPAITREMVDQAARENPSAGRLAARTDDGGGRLVPSGSASICNCFRGIDDA